VRGTKVTTRDNPPERYLYGLVASFADSPASSVPQNPSNHPGGTGRSQIADHLASCIRARMKIIPHCCASAGLSFRSNLRTIFEILSDIPQTAGAGSSLELDLFSNAEGAEN
jgi:hypothetical protein